MSKIKMSNLTPKTCLELSPATKIVLEEYQRITPGLESLDSVVQTFQELQPLYQKKLEQIVDWHYKAVPDYFKNFQSAQHYPYHLLETIKKQGLSFEKGQTDPIKVIFEEGGSTETFIPLYSTQQGHDEMVFLRTSNPDSHASSDLIANVIPRLYRYARKTGTADWVLTEMAFGALKFNETGLKMPSKEESIGLFSVRLNEHNNRIVLNYPEYTIAITPKTPYSDLVVKLWYRDEAIPLKSEKVRNQEAQNEQTSFWSQLCALPMIQIEKHFDSNPVFILDYSGKENVVLSPRDQTAFQISKLCFVAEPKIAQARWRLQLNAPTIEGFPNTVEMRSDRVLLYWSNASGLPFKRTNELPNHFELSALSSPKDVTGYYITEKHYVDRINGPAKIKLRLSNEQDVLGRKETWFVQSDETRGREAKKSFELLQRERRKIKESIGKEKGLKEAKKRRL